MSYWILINLLLVVGKGLWTETSVCNPTVARRFACRPQQSDTFRHIADGFGLELYVRKLSTGWWFGCINTNTWVRLLRKWFKWRLWCANCLMLGTFVLVFRNWSLFITSRSPTLHMTITALRGECFYINCFLAIRFFFANITVRGWKIPIKARFTRRVFKSVRNILMRLLCNGESLAGLLPKFQDLRPYCCLLCELDTSSSLLVTIKLRIAANDAGWNAHINFVCYQESFRNNTWIKLPRHQRHESCCAPDGHQLSRIYLTDWSQDTGSTCSGSLGWKPCTCYRLHPSGSFPGNCLACWLMQFLACLPLVLAILRQV